MKSIRKRIVFYILIVYIDILVIEAVSQILFFAHKGHFLFQQRPSEVFNVRDFSVITSNPRAVILRYQWVRPSAPSTYIASTVIGGSP